MPSKASRELPQSENKPHLLDAGHAVNYSYTVWEKTGNFSPVSIVSLDPFLPATLVGEDCVMGQKNVRAADRRLVSSRSTPGALRDDSKKGCVVACSRHSNSRAREKNSRRKKKRGMNRGGKGKRVLSPPPPFPPVFPAYNLTRSPLTAVLYLNAWDRLAV